MSASSIVMQKDRWHMERRKTASRHISIVSSVWSGLKCAAQAKWTYTKKKIRTHNAVVFVEVAARLLASVLE